jgi:hypothetical protein
MEKASKIVEIGIVNVDGVELYTRKPTHSREYVVDACTGYFARKDDCIRVNNVRGQPFVYVHKKWREQSRYGAKWQGVNPIKGKISDTSVRYAPEGEYKLYACTNIEAMRLHIAAAWQGQDTRDGTVDGEFKFPNRVNLSGYRDMLEDLNKWIDMSRDECGFHVNCSVPGWDSRTVSHLADHANGLFDEVTEYLENNFEDTVKVFGRFFSDEWATFPVGNYRTRYEWVNFRINEGYVEYRLPHFVNVKQAFDVTNLVIEWTRILNKFESTELTEREASHQLVKIFRRYADGKAPCQKASRNTLDRV